ncbi:hypothetical protein NO134_08730 [Ochrobactrum sp. BD22]|jgi:hypothetical protein|uniref:hypothetical protein n=2 Tax=unclassified Ochrobactrum TaxID=239106 RepID=UPI0019655CB3|nr:hypothetical protein [Ochrobactrum sp. 3-3]MBQ0707607.1 hypothetical protein [Ochrobactrum sp. AP1BH01-1]
MMETMLTSQQWLPVELLNIGLAAALFFACLVHSLWKAVFDELNPVFWRRTAALLWAGILIVALSGGIESFNWPQAIGWLLVLGGVAATVTRTGMSYYRQYCAHTSRAVHSGRARLSGR